MWIAFFKFLFYSFKPLSRTADVWDIKDIIQATVLVLGWGGGGSWTMTINTGIATGILAGIPALLFLVTGIKLQMKLMPKIKLVYEDKEPYKTVNEPYTHDTGKSIPSRVRYRVGLQLLGTKAAELKVTLVKSEPRIPRIPADLRPPPPNMSQSPTFTVYPKDEITDFVQVVSYPWQNEETGEKEIQVDFQYNSVQIARGKYIFTLLVQGKDVPLYKRKFVAEVDNNDKLQFYPV